MADVGKGIRYIQYLPSRYFVETPHYLRRSYGTNRTLSNVGSHHSAREIAHDLLTIRSELRSPKSQVCEAGRTTLASPWARRSKLSSLVEVMGGLGVSVTFPPREAFSGCDDK